MVYEQHTRKETVMLGPVAERVRLATLWDWETGVMLRAAQ